MILSSVAAVTLLNSNTHFMDNAGPPPVWFSWLIVLPLFYYLFTILRSKTVDKTTQNYISNIKKEIETKEIEIDSISNILINSFKQGYNARNKKLKESNENFNTNN